ncbi:SMI1/KNR4 family protein [Endomicrobium proavitum]|uniref:Putative Antitoxin YobK n=1 Tax=Endomicrobium proavitum TaxID=1408281 RepID=A0A0G3WJ11_9BACT|nr:SMI1/KNR4 family protein [Endomicrobium proavitum]AKL97872.1 putative Antitoxin YobK [Endomicrobium proavitum]
MYSFQKLEDLISKYSKVKSFTGGVNGKKIAYIEKELNVILPEQYKWFLAKYGYGGVLGIEILGAALNNTYPVIEYTQNCREYNLNKQWIVIENCDEYYYCLSCEDGKVRDWDLRKKTYYEYPNFVDFLYETIMDSAENWQE